MSGVGEGGIGGNLVVGKDGCIGVGGVGEGGGAECGMGGAREGSGAK